MNMQKQEVQKSMLNLVGTGMTADAFHLTAPHPEGLGACNVMKLAVSDAGLKPEDIDYINVHGTATPLGDISETKAIVNVFGEHAYKLNISSTKSMTGHLLGAAGAIEAIATIMAVVHDIVPPTINFKVPDPDIDQNLNLPSIKHRTEKLMLPSVILLDLVVIMLLLSLKKLRFSVFIP